MKPDQQFMVKLIHGGGLRLMECLRLRVKDIDLETNQVLVRDAKGMKDRVTVLPDNVRDTLQVHLAGMTKPITVHTFRHCFTTHLLEANFDIRTVQELLGYKDVPTTMI